MKKLKIPLHLNCEGPFMDMDHSKFVDYCGGEVAVGLFKGDLRQAINGVIFMAHSRGMKRQHEVIEEFLKNKNVTDKIKRCSQCKRKHEGDCPTI